jgi:hypothetical protein
MPFGATPSRWCVYQFHHLGEYSVVRRATGSGGGGAVDVLAQRTQWQQALGQGYFGAAAGAVGSGGGVVAGAGATGAD